MAFNYPTMDLGNSQMLFSGNSSSVGGNGVSTASSNPLVPQSMPAPPQHTSQSQSQSPHSGPIEGSVLSPMQPMLASSSNRAFPSPSAHHHQHHQHQHQHHPFIQENLFVLPSELQGGIGNISSRRPSYAAESFTRLTEEGANDVQGSIHNATSPQPSNSANSPRAGANNGGNYRSNQSKNLAAFAAMNSYNFNLDTFNESFGNFNLNSNFNDFQARRPSQLVDFQPAYSQVPPYMYHQNAANFSTPGSNAGKLNQILPQQSQQPSNQQGQRTSLQPHSQNADLQTGGSGNILSGPGGYEANDNSANANSNPSNSTKTSANNNLNNISAPLKLDGLSLQDQYIISSPDLKSLYSKVTKYFQDENQTDSILKELHQILQQPTILKLITFIKNLNNLTFNHKTLCLVINKNGKFDLLSYPNNSNIFLQKSDLVIVDGDRGKDLVMILEPLIDLNTAILFNFLKKLEHLKSLTIQDNRSSNNNGGINNGKKSNGGGTHSTSLNASQIIAMNSNEDNEFIITLPTKQVLRFATPKEVHKLSGKFLEEKKAFITCLNKIRELNLQHDLELINVEYQSDFKKLIFYYFAGFKRIDFRSLIKELFKIYKTRIWLCAVLPFDKPELYITQEDGTVHGSSDGVIITERTPNEYELSNEQILKFSINEFQNLSTPNYFHSSNLQNLITHLKNEINGNFYGFNNDNPIPAITPNIVGLNAKKKDLNAQGHNNQVQQPIIQGIPKREGIRQGLISQSTSSKILPNFNPFGDSS